jgi:hypothetical protein
MAEHTLTEVQTALFSLLPLPSMAITKRFNSLTAKWKNETAHLSNVVSRCIHPAFQEITGMGTPVIPLILQDSKQSMDDWFWALSAITCENPITKDDAWNLRKMTHAWIRWARAGGNDI